MADRFRLYKSALNDVVYIHGFPLKFEPKLAKERESGFYQAVRDFEQRREERAQRAADKEREAAEKAAAA